MWQAMLPGSRPGRLAIRLDLPPPRILYQLEVETSGYEVDVVSHQTVRPDLDVPASRSQSKGSQVRAIVPVGEEGRLSAVTALRDVMRYAGNDASGQSRHLY